MALPSNLMGGLMPKELTFLAENDPVTIIPRALMKKITLIGADVPALRANRRIDVPLWVAVILKLRGKCRIVPPPWLTLEYLERAYEEEKREPNKFLKLLPQNWMEVSKILLARAPDDMLDTVTQLRLALQDLRETRLLKINSGLKDLNESNFTLTGLSLMEVNEMRPFVVEVMDNLRKLDDTMHMAGATQEAEYDMEDDDEFD